MRPDDPLLKLPGYVLRRASAATLAELNGRLAKLGVRHTDAAFLILVAGQPGLTQSEACRIFEMQRANMVPLVARLERRGIVARHRVDGRSQGLVLTASGAALHKRARRIVERYEAELLRRVPARWRALVLPILMALWRPGR